MNPTMNETQDERNVTAWIIPGLAIGAAVGLAYAASHRKKSRWELAKKRVADNGEELIDVGRNVLARLRFIYEEGRKVVEEVSELWSHRRKLVRR